MTRSGLWISFVGMDGAGKTSVSTTVKKMLERRGFRVALLYGGRGKDNVLPVDLLRRKPVKKKPLEYDVPFVKKENLHTGLKGKIKRLRAWIIIWVFYFDQLLKYLVQIHPLRRTNEVVLLDRDATDILMIEGVPMMLKRGLYYLIPKPSMVFYLYHDVETLSSRKKNHPVKDLQRQQLIYNTILPFLNPVMLRSDDINLTANNIVSDILSAKGI